MKGSYKLKLNVLVNYFLDLMIISADDQCHQSSIFVVDYKTTS